MIGHENLVSVVFPSVSSPVYSQDRMAKEHLGNRNRIYKTLIESSYKAFLDPEEDGQALGSPFRPPGGSNRAVELRLRVKGPGLTPVLQPRLSIIPGVQCCAGHCAAYEEDGCRGPACGLKDLAASCIIGLCKTLKPYFLNPWFKPRALTYS